MIYSATREDLGFAHDPFKAIVAPRPIGWITALSAKGEVNLSPYSFFNAISSRPNLVMFSSENKKDAVSFIEETGEFTCSLVSGALMQQMNLTSAPLPRGQSEYSHAGLEMAPSRLVKPPRVAGTPAALECKSVSIQQLRDIDGNDVPRWMVIGQVLGIFIDDAFVKDGRFDTAGANPIARCGYADYAEVTSVFSLQRPVGG
ncbi:flavin reductase family protein [Bosea sp. SSUT16]|jgi:flavin reductase (DIM6/NTAB) family NADH-FMN oxidoreductase RutF|uniref:Flavin reductase family protein n=1 Tax=Bosea spartocytisi TaxID=2773451 RepID=A0A927EFN1_9HYPH|nr:flavin reductase family protein [Bosea spartocytisi]MBD3848179.1 flavin reductase family protein [Bosea spartocytisi]MCT4471755.1 flavin reductase family protein [Bosea spartocytisi]